MRRHPFAMAAVVCSLACSDATTTSPQTPEPDEAVEEVEVAPIPPPLPTAGVEHAWVSDSLLLVWDTRPVEGMNSHLHRYEHMDLQIRQMADAGMDIARINLNWRDAEVAPGIYQPVDRNRELHNGLDNFAQNLDRILELGLEPLVILSTPPNSLVGASVDGADRAEFDERFARFTADMVALFPEVRLWSLWNEADAGWWGHVWSDTGFPYADRKEQGVRYAETVRTVHGKVRTMDSGALLVMTSLTGNEAFVPTPDGMAVDEIRVSFDFLDGFLEAGGAEHVAMLDLHAYGAMGSENGPFNKMLRLQEVLDEHGVRRPVLLSEFGHSAAIYRTDVGAMPHELGLEDASTFDEAQVDYVRAVVEANRAGSVFKAVLPYAQFAEVGRVDAVELGLRDPACGAHPPGHPRAGEPKSECAPGDFSLSLYREDLVTPRPAWVWLASVDEPPLLPRTVEIVTEAADGVPIDVPSRLTGDARVITVELDAIVPKLVRIRPVMDDPGGTGR